MYYSIATGIVAKNKSGCASGRADEWFYYHKSGNKNESWSSTWTVVDKNGSKDGLRRYLKKSSKNSYTKLDFKYDPKTLYKYVKVGDIIQLGDGNHKYGHSIIVSSVSGTQVRYCSHTSTRRNANLADNIKKGKELSIYRPKQK